MTKASDATAGLPGAARPEIVFGVFTLLPEHRRLLAGESVVKLGSRALDLLIHLASRPGEVISHRELTAAAWAGAQVEESNLRFQIGQLRKALAEHADGAEHVTSVPGRGYCFTATVTPGAPAQPVMVRPAGSSSLPPEPSNLIGRSADVEILLGCLARHRLVTVVGTGGVGKTTLAAAVMHRIGGPAGPSPSFVDLTTLDDPSLVPSAVASALGIPVGSANPMPQVVKVLADTDVLLVLDNCEHVIDAVALAAEAILRGAPSARILATSREPLRLSGEAVHHLLPLAAPFADADDPLAFSAVQLFCDRARLQSPDLALDPAQARLVGEICRQVDGLPLAIELVAARMRTLGLAGLVELLRNGAELAHRSAVPRHRSLQATFDWSYALLSEAEARALRTLSIFTGHFSLNAALSVLDDGTDRSDHLEVLSALADKSHLVLEAAQGGARYRLLQMTRQFALRKLRAAGEEAGIARRHVACYAGLLEGARAASGTRHGGDGVAALAFEIGNVRAALVWAFGPGGDAELAVRLVACSAPLFLHLSLLAECVDWTGRALGAKEFTALGPTLRLELKAARSVALRYTRGNGEDARTALHEALDLAEAEQDLAYQIRLLEGLYIFALRLADFKAAMAYAERGRASVWHSLTDTGLATGDWMVGVLDHFMGRQAEARLRCGHALRNFPLQRRPEVVRFGIDQRMLAHCAIARALWVQGLPDQAATAVDGVVRETDAIGHPVSLCTALLWTAPVALWSGDLDRAAEALATGRVLASRHSLVPYELLARALTGQLHALRGDLESGIALLSEGLAGLVEVSHLTMNSALQLALAEALIEAGRAGEALAEAGSALVRIERDEELTLVPEAWRIKGRALAAQEADREAERAEEAFRHALQIAQDQGALSYRLRAATDLAEYLSRRGRIGEAPGLLSHVCDALTEGRSTRDVLRATRLLERLTA
jgi:predicted ATPase/DNA-binding winged helix-turn-helix (wHTH) protein